MAEMGCHRGEDAIGNGMPQGPSPSMAYLLTDGYPWSPSPGNWTLYGTITPMVPFHPYGCAFNPRWHAFSTMA
jgi:hypothetical protein